MEKELPVKEEVWIFAEHRQGECTDAALGLLGEGKRLCKKITGSRLCAIVLGHGKESPAQDLGSYGADRIYSLEHESLEPYSTDTAASLIADFVRDKAPFLVLFPADSLGADLAARVAARLRVALVTNCVDIKMGSGRRLEFVKPVSDEMLYASVQTAGEGVRIATVVPDVMDPEEPDKKNRAEVQEIHPSLGVQADRLRTLERIKGDPRTISLEEAEIVVAGGRGVGDSRSFQLIHDLADALQGSVGGSRPVVDDGNLPFERQIGRTGKNTSPKLFVACGISGASEFTGGMEKSKKIVVVNTDKNAPILKMADLGVVADAREVIPEIVRRVREKKEKEKRKSPEADKKKP